MVDPARDLERVLGRAVPGREVPGRVVLDRPPYRACDETLVYAF